MSPFESLPPVRRIPAWELQDGKVLTNVTKAIANQEQLVLAFSDWYAVNRYLRNDEGIVQDDVQLMFWLCEFRADLQRLFSLMDEIEAEEGEDDDDDDDDDEQEYAP